ncbi:MAG TPA: SRPBCC domain-containing protein [Gaiellaceae bacterium]
MAVNEIVVRAAPQRVFAVLADPEAYAEWVVGAAAAHAADGAWPAVGSSLRHSTGIGPLTIDDSTSVVAAEPPSRLELLARLGPLGSFRIVIALEQVGDELTHVTMEEGPVEGVSRLAGPVGDAAGRVRNTLSLARLKALAER